MRVHQACVPIVLLAASISASAMNRCTDAAGKVTYSDKPCASTEQRSSVKVNDSAGFNPERLPRRIDVVPPSHANGLETSMPQQAAPAGVAIIGRTQAEIACANAKSEYEDLAAKKRAALEEIRLLRDRASSRCGVPVAQTKAHLLREAQAGRQVEHRAEVAREQQTKPPAQPLTIYRCDDGGCLTSMGHIRGESAANAAARGADPNEKTLRGPQGRMKVCNRFGKWGEC